MENGNEQYWNCIIGPIDPKHLSGGMDSPMRKAANRAFFTIAKEHADNTWSGWGMDLEQKDFANAIMCLEKDSPTYKKIKKILKSGKYIP